MRPKALLLDGDGVIWLDNEAIPGVVDALNELRNLGIRLVLVTNNSSKTRAQYLKFIERVGLVGFTESDVFSSGFACGLYMQSRNISRAYVKGYPSLCHEISEAGITVLTGTLTPEEFEKPLDAILVSMCPTLTYDDLSHVIAIKRRHNPLLVGTNPDPNFPVGQRQLLPGSGSVVRMFESAFVQDAVVVGKPGAIMFEMVLRYLNLTADEVVMVGDRIITDIKFGSRNGARTALVLTGVDTMKDVEEAEEVDKPTWVMPSLVEVAELLKNMEA
jgi:HAD superfamily hydrolase (TIGR01450 family)